MITGIYSCNDGGFYYVRTTGDADGQRLFWFGEFPGGFSNVHVGVLRAIPGRTGAFSIDDGAWYDVPKGIATSAGTLDLTLEANVIQKLQGTGGFSGSRWTKINGRPACGARTNLKGFTGEGLTGVWVGNDGGIYYVRQKGAEIVWFGEGCANPGVVPAFANVFQGSISGSNFGGQWADVPYGNNIGSGTINLRAVNPNRIERVTQTGGFGGSVWERSSTIGNRVVTDLQVTITTGGDDLRPGAVAYGIVDLKRRGPLPKVTLNRGAWGGNSTNTVSISLSRAGEVPIRLRDLASLILEQDGAPRNIFETYNNWNVDFIKVVANTPQGPVCLANGCGQPLVRLTGEQTSFKLAISLP
ncbi:MAG: hypothetical protein HC851_24970 [Acaryochloris sp. RU_4_1]|nr:hypothetical protein [Acaryochloris sp. RU_4_1]